MIIKLKLFILKLLNIGLTLRLYRAISKNKRFDEKYNVSNLKILSDLTKEEKRLKDTNNHIKDTNIYLNFVNMNDMIKNDRFSLHWLGKAESFFYSCCGGLTFNVISRWLPDDDEEEYEVILIHTSEFVANKFTECIDYDKDPLNWNWHQMVCSAGLIETYLFAHEIAHALYGHALKKNQYSTNKEFMADEYVKTTLLKDDFDKIKLDELIRHCTNTVQTMYNNLLSTPQIYYPKTGKIKKAERKYISKFNSKIIYKILELEFYDRLTPLLYPKENPDVPKIML